MARRLPIRQALGLVGAVSATKAVQGRISGRRFTERDPDRIAAPPYRMGPIIRGFAAPRNAEEKIGRLLIQYEATANELDPISLEKKHLPRGRRIAGNERENAAVAGTCRVGRIGSKVICRSRRKTGRRAIAK